MKKIDVSIIIVNYNTSQMLKECVSSIYEHTKDLIFEIIIVDNASSDRSFSEMKFLFPEIQIIELDSNVGFGRANNIGAQAAKGDYLFFLNSDTLLIENSIKKLIEFYKQNELTTGAVGCTLVNREGELTDFCGEFPNFYKSKLKWIFDKYNNADDRNKELLRSKDPFKVDYIIGADLFLSNNLFKELGGFSPQYFMYFEEVDLQKRIALLNKDRVILPYSKIIHFGGGSIEGLNNANHQARMMFIRSQSIYFKKHNRISYHLIHIHSYLMIFKILFNSKFTFKENWSYFKLLLK